MRNFFQTAALVFIMACMSFIASCGKKGEPTLKAYEKPAAPQLLSAVHREHTVNLSWSYRKDKESALAGFAILRSGGKGFEKIAVAEPGLRSYVDNAIGNGETLSYKITAINSRGVLSNDSNVISLLPQTPPAPPRGLAGGLRGDELVLSWDSVGKEILYNVYKSYEKSGFVSEPLNSAPLQGTTFKDRLDTRRPSYYAVRSCLNPLSLDEGPLSGEIVFDPAELVPQAPSDVRFFAAPDKVFLFWNEPAESWVAGFRIYRRAGGGDYAPIGETLIPSFVDKETPASPRDYRIHALGPVKQGPGAELRGIIFVPDR